MSIQTAEPVSLYKNLLETLGHLEDRDTKYQFDLNKDVEWNSFEEDGGYITQKMAEELGIDANLSIEHPELWRLLAWALSINICNGFILVELGIVLFLHQKQNHLSKTRSVALFREEEEKHIKLFQKLRTRLADYRPMLSNASTELEDNIARFGSALSEGRASFNPLTTYLEQVEPVFGERGVHYLLWMHILLFEEYSIHIYTALIKASQAIQPVWLSAHKAHAREEAQHVATDVRYLAALNLTDHERTVLSALFASFLLETNEIHHIVIGGAQQLMEQSFPDLKLMANEVDQPVRVLQRLVSQKTFSGSTQSAPFLQTLVTLKPEEVWRQLCFTLGPEFIADRNPDNAPWRNTD